MKIFDYIEKYAYEELVFFHDNTTGLKGITCIHSTKLGPSLGGTRIWNYKNEDEAIEDALRLARGMTLKSSAAGLDLGGGKTVLIGDPEKVKSEGYFRAFGRFVESLNGRYITAEDVNTSPEDMEFIAKETQFVKGLRHKSGDPSPMTAYGVYQAIRASAFKYWGDNSLRGKKISVQGLGNVGSHLCKYLYDEGAILTVSDINEKKVKSIMAIYDCKAVAIDDIYSEDADIFAPCGLGAVVNDDTIKQFKCSIIAGAANNVLKEDSHGEILKSKSILYAPDYVANAGGVINISFEGDVYDKDAALRATEKIYDRLLDIFEISKKENIPTNKAADKMALDRIECLSKIHSTYIRK